MDRHYRNFPPPLTPRYYGQGVVYTLLDDLRMYGNAFAMMEPHGQDWPATKEEESRMKQIDFSKPLRGAESHRPMTVLKEGLTLVKTDDGHAANHYYVVDEHGKQYGYATSAPSEFRAVENVPEEPKDHIILFKSRVPPHDWQVNQWSDGTAVPYTKTEAEHQARGEAGRYIAVKVPV